jgi:ribosomal subunit interface protein
VEIVVKGRHCEVSDRFRQHVKEKLTRIERFDAKCFRLDVTCSQERNPRLAGARERVELTVHSRGPVIRAEAAANDPYAALDIATAKLEERLRRAADRRAERHSPHVAAHVRRGQAAGTGILDSAQSNEPLLGTAAAAPAMPAPVAPSSSTAGLNGSSDAKEQDLLIEDGPLVVREKMHEAPPMTLDDALHQMELVGHDFYLYCDQASGTPSVVYRRRGYDYGVLRLVTVTETREAER